MWKVIKCFYDGVSKCVHLITSFYTVLKNQQKLSGVNSVHWNGNIFILMTFSSLAPLEVVKMTTSSAASDENYVKMTIFSFQCCCYWQYRRFSLWKSPVPPVTTKSLFTYSAPQNSHFKTISKWYTIEICENYHVFIQENLGFMVAVILVHALTIWKQVF